MAPTPLAAPTAYPHAVVGFKAVHVRGPSDAPSRQVLEHVDLHRLLHKHKVVVCHAETTERRAETDMATCRGLWNKHRGNDFTGWCIHCGTWRKPVSTCAGKRVLTSHCWAVEGPPGLAPGDRTCLETHSDGGRFRYCLVHKFSLVCFIMEKKPSPFSSS